MRFAHYQLSDDVLLDARRGLWLESHRTLVVADLHLGFPWAQRQRGQLLPLGDTCGLWQRLASLLTDHAPQQTVLLGDIIHRAVSAPALKGEVQHLLELLGNSGSSVAFLAGNHDRNLQRILKQLGAATPLLPSLDIGAYRLMHGHEHEPGTVPGRTFIIGHEHPALALGDGITAGYKFPCFLIGHGLIVLPAFSDWAAGTVVGRNPFLSPFARQAQFTQAVAVMGDKLLPIPWSELGLD